MTMVHKEFEDDVDDIDRQIADALADPKFRKRLDDFKRKDAAGEIKWVSHDEARRRLGLHPLPKVVNS